ncbi:MAG: cyclodeaminase/cyclohydrolase family protein [Candidatus Baltobacteraceae bacterium]
MDSLDGYLTKLASSEPTPGGGSAAMVCGALACSLVAMVARICHAEGLAEEADALREQMTVMREQDERAFQAVVDAKGDADAVQRALFGAAAAPLQGAGAAFEALKLCERALALNNRHLISDVGCAAEFAHAAVTACAYNVRVNHRYIKASRERADVAAQRTALGSLEAQARALYQRTADAVAGGL